MPKRKKKAQHYVAGVRLDIDDTYKFRSSWEANMARLLNYLDLHWRFEYKRFYMKNGDTYLPDFLILSEDNPWNTKWLEIKGLWHKGDKKRMISFMNEFPEETLKIITSKEYKKLEKKYKPFIPRWE